MFKIGIIGTENSHAMAFAKYYNLPDPETGKMHFDDIRVTAIMGDPESNAQIVEETGVEFVAQTAEEMVDLVDAVMITNRKGSEHMQYALPFAAAGKPMFVDKPFTSDPAEAEKLAKVIAQSGCPVMGGSACKCLPDVAKIKELVAELREKGEFFGAAMSFKIIQVDSPHDGLYFYAPHLVEMCLEAFGTDIQSVQAIRQGDNVLACVKYPNDLVSLHFTTRGGPSCLVFAREKNHHFDIDVANLFSYEAAPFAELLHGKAQPLTADQLVKPIHIIAAIKESIETGKTVEL